MNRPLLLASYVVLELWRYFKFKQLSRKLGGMPLHFNNDGRYHVLDFIKRAVASGARWDRERLLRFTREKETSDIGYGGGPLSWQRIYSSFAWNFGAHLQSV